MRLGLQVPRFSFPGGRSDTLFDTLVGIARSAEGAGFDALFVMDHFQQVPQMGAPSDEMLEAYTTLAALAPMTSTLLLGTLVTDVQYRNPAHLAKIVTTLDVVSKGRAVLGIGAGWFEAEHRAYGYDFPAIGERMDRLEDAIRTCRDMFEHECATSGAWNNPRPVRPGGPLVMVGGTGERRTLRIAAEHADLLNTNPPFVDLPRKLDVLAAHCADVGRDRATLSVSSLATVYIGPTHDVAMAKLAADATRRSGGAVNVADPDVFAALTARAYVGTPDEVSEQVVRTLSTGIDGVVVMLPDDAHDEEMMAMVGAAVQQGFEEASR